MSKNENNTTKIPPIAKKKSQKLISFTSMIEKKPKFLNSILTKTHKKLHQINKPITPNIQALIKTLNKKSKTPKGKRRRFRLTEKEKSNGKLHDHDGNESFGSNIGKF